MWTGSEPRPLALLPSLEGPECCFGVKLPCRHCKRYGSNVVRQLLPAGIFVSAAPDLARASTWCTPCTTQLVVVGACQWVEAALLSQVHVPIVSGPVHCSLLAARGGRCWRCTLGASAGMCLLTCMLDCRAHAGVLQWRGDEPVVPARLPDIPDSLLASRWPSGQWSVVSAAADRRGVFFCNTCEHC